VSNNNDTTPGSMQLDEFGNRQNHDSLGGAASEDMHSASELEAVYDVPVKVQAVLGKSQMEVNQLLKLAPGAVIELDRRVGEAVDIYVNNRLVARGEVVIVDEHLGVTMTEIVKNDKIG
jgi:flagellar motor switch protein FliN